jgi:hypothetical protein
MRSEEQALDAKSLDTALTFSESLATFCIRLSKQRPLNKKDLMRIEIVA